MEIAAGSTEDKVIVQDNLREIQLARLLDLKQMPGRWGHDAEDVNGNKFELKTTTKSGFGTARDVSVVMLNLWRKRYWIFSTGVNLVSGFKFEEIFFLSPQMLEGWFYSMEKRFTPDTTLRDFVLSQVSKKINEEKQARLKYLINRGMTYNNPKIPLNYVRDNGIPLRIDNCRTELKKLVAKNPIDD